MLADFQQALADLTAAPELCVRVRRDPALLNARYRLSEREWRRLVAIVRDRGMEAACMLYRANRLAPLAVHLPGLCKALGPDLRDLVSDYWAAFPQADVHAFVEVDRFCDFVRRELDRGRSLVAEVAPLLAAEGARAAAALRASRTEDARG
jgi:hypothetical protein